MQLVISDSIDRVKDALTAAYVTLNGDLSELNQAIAIWVADSTKDRFRTKTAPDGSAWKTLSPLTQQLKGNDNILIGKNNLLDSITSYSTDSSAVVGTAADYAATHQFGATIRPKNGQYLRFGNERGGASLTSVTIPARPFIGLSDDDEREILDLAADFAAGVFDD